jgi:hypothetical protein
VSFINDAAPCEFFLNLTGREPKFKNKPTMRNRRRRTHCQCGNSVNMLKE